MISKIKYIAVALAAASLLLLTACEEQQYQYMTKTYDESVLEEIIEDTIEVENPNLDIEVNIITEVDE